jgi:Aromatic-ring-opening dioxygenase LigAB, LigA subunit
MSRYEVDKVLRAVAREASARSAFLADPGAYLEGRDLTAEERDALHQHDYTTLYRLGAHPFLLWPFTTKLAAEQGRAGREVMREYMAAITPLGRPDYTT